MLLTSVVAHVKLGAQLPLSSLLVVPPWLPLAWGHKGKSISPRFLSFLFHTKKEKTNSQKPE